MRTGRIVTFTRVRGLPGRDAVGRGEDSDGPVPRIVSLAGPSAWALMLGRCPCEGSDRAGGGQVATYKMIYGDEENVVEETLDDITAVESEDGWIVMFREDDAILRVQEDHVQSLELVSA